MLDVKLSDVKQTGEIAGMKLLDVKMQGRQFQFELAEIL